MKTSEQEYPLCEDLGWLINAKTKRNIPKSMMDIGLGPSIYIYMMKEFIKLFVFLTILHIPIYILCYSGRQNHYG